jgi:signal transduction histidine kinase
LRLEIELALRTCREPSEYAQALGGALESAERLSALSEDLLELARIDAVPSQEKCALSDALDDALADVSPLARARSVELRLEPAEPSPSVRGARRALGRVFRNLLENAVRFSPEGATVTVEVKETDETVSARIVDHGPGIRSGDEERIFEPFVRAASSSEGHSEGTGLGLSIARQLAQAAGGDVRAEAGTEGAVMVVSLLRVRPTG